MFDERARYCRRLRRLRRATRRWSVLAGVLTGAATVLTPYAGLSVIDGAWAAAAGGAVVLAGWRWADYRALAGQPVPPVADPTTVAHRTRLRIEEWVGAVPGGRDVLTQLRRHGNTRHVRNTAVTPGWRRLDRAVDILADLPMPREGPAATAATQAAVAERDLRDLARRAAGLQRALPYGTPGHDLGRAHDALVAEFEQGVTAYETLVAATAAYLAEEGRATPQQPTLDQLTEATELLRGTTEGFVELRATPVTFRR
ncbi:hypothetical protein GCM10009682_00390 [Luedemannella flava]|uniref:Uncharacterized protein n=1 Tax=Luedemannella flava TaxID=349316 RepID=A0ABN2LCR9_9ACTN